MTTNAFPVFEVKNKLPFFIHKAEEEGPVAISRRGEVVAFIISKKDLEDFKEKSPKKSLFERLQENRKKYGLEDDDFDYTEYFDSLRLRGYSGRPEGEQVFDEV